MVMGSAGAAWVWVAGVWVLSSRSSPLHLQSQLVV